MRNFSCRAALCLTMAAGISFLAGCATYPPPKEEIRNSRTYSNSYNDVWETVLNTLAEQNIQVRSSGKQSGEIAAEDNTIELRQYDPGRYDSRYCFCGSPPQYHSLRDMVGEYRISVTPSSLGRTSVEIDVTYKAAIYSGERFTGWLPCLSKGIFEPSFLTQVESRMTTMNTPAPPPSPSKVEKKSPPRNLDWWKPSRGY